MSVSRGGCSGGIGGGKVIELTETDWKWAKKGLDPPSKSEKDLNKLGFMGQSEEALTCMVNIPLLAGECGPFLIV